MRLLFVITLSLLMQLSAFNAFSKSDLTQFDFPFLLGDWYLTNPDPGATSEDFRTIRIQFASNYSFAIQIQKKDYSIEQWQGSYNASEDTLVLGLDTDTPQIYEYELGHNQLNLNGVTFYKSLSNAIAGIWTSEKLEGTDILASKVSKMDLILQPDFVFMFRSANEDGVESIHSGVYYMEGDHLILMYEDGEQDTVYTLIDDKLTLSGEDFDMVAVMNRVR